MLGWRRTGCVVFFFFTRIENRNIAAFLDNKQNGKVELYMTFVPPILLKVVSLTMRPYKNYSSIQSYRNTCLSLLQYCIFGVIEMHLSFLCPQTQVRLI